MTLCAKPGCARPGAALLHYDYAARKTTLEDARMPSPHEYLLCASCAEGLVPPRGWTLDDRRAEPPLFAPAEPAEEVRSQVVLTGEPLGPEVRQLFFGESA